MECSLDLVVVLDFYFFVRHKVLRVLRCNDLHPFLLSVCFCRTDNGLSGIKILKMSFLFKS